MPARGSPLAAGRRLLKTALARLGALHGDRQPHPRGNAVDVLVGTILSQNTNDRNRDRAYEALRMRYPRWEDVLAATDGAVARVIRSGGLANQKAQRIRRILAHILEERGTLDLGFLRRWRAPRST